MRRLITSPAAGALLLAGIGVAAVGGGLVRLRPPGTERQAAAEPVEIPFAPQYPLWSDGAEKRRWISLPAGAAIDASDPDAWVFPVGTRLRKEFWSGGRRVETRTIERLADGTWSFATYVWSPDGRSAERDDDGAVVEVAPGVTHTVPSATDCLACHAGSPPVLGFSALQLSPDRDPLAPHAGAPPEGAVDLAELVRRGLVRGLPEAIVRTPPRIAARSPVERAALGYLHGNCGGCHGRAGALTSLDLTLSSPLAAGATPPGVDSTVAHPSVFRPSGTPPGARPVRVAPGRPDRSVLLARMRALSPLSRMPPLGTHQVDREAVDLIARWIEELPTLDATERNRP